MNIFNMGPFEMAIIGIVALLAVGPRRLPELGRMLGGWMRTFRDAADEMKRGIYMEDDFRRPPPPSTVSSGQAILDAQPPEENEDGGIECDGGSQTILPSANDPEEDSTNDDAPPSDPDPIEEKNTD